MIYKILFASLVNFSTILGCAQMKPDSPRSSLPLDRSIIQGELDNGLSYYIKVMEEPQPDLDMRFYIKAGINNEEQHELDFAHAIEHLAFRNTKNFPNGLFTNSDLLASLEMSSTDLYAATAHRYTEYMFYPPSHHNRAIETGFDWFKDIAEGLNISKENVNKERGALLQEFRGEDATMNAYLARLKLYSLLFPCNSGFEDFEEHNRNFSENDLRKFYEEWYRPELMAITIVGNIRNVDHVEKMIREKFSDLESPQEPISSPHCDSEYFRSAPRFALVRREKDPETISTKDAVTINMFFRDPLTPEQMNSWRGIKRKIMNNFLQEVLSLRINEMSKRYDNPFRVSATSTSELDKSPNALRIIINSERGKEEQALEEAISILDQLKTFGVTEKELEIVKQEFLETNPLSAPESSSYWIENLRNYVTRNIGLPDNKTSLLRSWVKQFSTKDFNNLVEEVISGMPEDIGVTVTEDYRTSFESEEKIRSFIKQTFENSVNPYNFPGIPQKLMSEEQLESLKTSTHEKREGDIKEVQEYLLPNGVRLILNPILSTGGTERLKIHGFSEKGASCFPRDEYFSATYAPSIVSHSGVGDFDKFEIRRYLNTTASLQEGVSPYISYNGSGVKGEASIEELDDFLQLLYLYFTQPRKDRVAFADWQERQVNQAYSNSGLNDFIDARNELINDFSTRPIATERASAARAVDLDAAYKIYNLIFRNAEDFTFVITGNFDVTSILPKAAKYLGNLPNSGKEGFCNGPKWTVPVLPEGPEYKEFTTPEHYTTENAFYGFSYIRPQSDYDWKEEIKVQALGAVTDRLIKSLRTDGLHLYWFGVRGRFNRVMERYEINSSFAGISEELATVKERSREIISEIKDGKISEGVFKDAMKGLYARNSSSNLKSRSEEQERLYNFINYGEPLTDPLKIESYTQSLSIQDIVETAQKYYKDEYLYEAVMQQDIDHR